MLWNRLAGDVQLAHSRHHKGAAIFIDVEKAFDSVWHKGLRCTLLNTNLRDKRVRLMSSFITDRKTSDKINMRLETKFHLMPVHLRARFQLTSFLIYENDIPIDPFSNTVGVFQFADFGLLLKVKKKQLNIG